MMIFSQLLLVLLSGTTAHSPKHASSVEQSSPVSNNDIRKLMHIFAVIKNMRNNDIKQHNNPDYNTEISHFKKTTRFSDNEMKCLIDISSQLDVDETPLHKLASTYEGSMHKPGAEAAGRTVKNIDAMVQQLRCRSVKKLKSSIRPEAFQALLNLFQYGQQRA